MFYKERKSPAIMAGLSWSGLRLNSSPSVLLPLGYTTDITTHIITVIAIPRFETGNPLHQALASFSQRAHKLAAQGESSEKELHDVEEEIDCKAAELWGF